MKYDNQFETPRRWLIQSQVTGNWHESPDWKQGAKLMGTHEDVSEAKKRLGLQ